MDEDIKKEISLEEAVSQLKSGKEDNDKLLEEILEHTAYVDLVIGKVKETEMGAKLISKIEADIEYEISSLKEENIKLLESKEEVQSVKVELIKEETNV